MHILHTYHDWDVDQQSGVPSVIQDIIKALEGRHELSVLMEDWDSTRPTVARDARGRTFHRLRLVPPPASPMNIPALLAWPARLLIGAWRLRVLCRDLGIDVVHVHYPAARHLSMRVARALGGPPYLVTCHRGDILRYPRLPRLQRWSMRRAMRGADAVTAVSRWLARTATDMVGLKRKAACVFNGYTPPSVALSGREELEAVLKRRLPERFAVMVANYYPYKGHDVALAAWRDLAVERSELTLIAVGGGPGLDACRAAVRDQGLEDHVWLLGSQSRAVALSLIAAAELLVAPSRSEGYSMVILEAAALGTPIVCSDIPPFLELVTDGETAHVFPCEDGHAMARAVRRAIEDPERTAAMACRLRRIVETRFSVSAMASEYEALYGRLHRSRRPTRIAGEENPPC